MNEVTTNKNNWTGESVTVQYDDAGRFEYAGYSFQVGPFEAFGSEVLKGEGLRSGLFLPAHLPNRQPMVAANLQGVTLFFK
jgi:hypothetical protein